MINDQYNLRRYSAQLEVYKQAVSVSDGSVSYSSLTAVSGVKVNGISYEMGTSLSWATLVFPLARWSDNPVKKGDRIIIATSEGAVLYRGYIVTIQRDSRGGTGEGSVPSESFAVICNDDRYLLARCNVMYGQWCRRVTDYVGFMTSRPLIVATGSYCGFMSARRCVFNENGKPNLDKNSITIGGVESWLFTAIESEAIYWPAFKMIEYILSYLNQGVISGIWQPVFTGLAITEMAVQPQHVVIEQMSPLDALSAVCNAVGCSFTMLPPTTSSATPILKFFARTEGTAHELYSPAPGESLADIVATGAKVIHTLSLTDDTLPIINNPLAMSAPHKFEITAEFVPAWLDSDLLVTETGGVIDNPDPAMIAGRKWALNEAGDYSDASTFGRGSPFDFSTVIDPAMVTGSGGDFYGPFKRSLNDCLSYNNSPVDNRPIKVEFSFDRGTTWYEISGAITAVRGECAIYITEKDLTALAPEGITLDPEGPQNYWQSIAQDNLDDNAWGYWQTRVRVTFSVTMDQRDVVLPASVPTDGTPFTQYALFDFADRYFYNSIESSSVYTSSQNVLTDDLLRLNAHLQRLQSVNSAPAISGMFILDRMWYDLSGPTFIPGDTITNIAGRGVSLTSAAGRSPEIIRVTLLPDANQTQLVTRDSRRAPTY